MCLPLMRPILGTWPATQACALTGKRTSDLLVHRPVLSPLSCPSQVYLFIENGEEREKQREKHQYAKSAASRMSPTGNQTGNLLALERCPTYWVTAVRAQSSLWSHWSRYLIKVISVRRGHINVGTRGTAESEQHASLTQGPETHR